ncbi:hypothetical protein SAMN05421594_2981 [Chryseobacterium oleae]|uniref:DUF3108 domain-containing protein n=1 Tax=Chryseobacterium oleae TaxID=491207 RepID=A0A1I4ZHK3_CHROL|nr:hypothetical protein [Chryseobacterium oleae]SFN49459.1 hypothetical protein SAMN05421594_2981 [Chryseobacterium oleae]
MKTQIITLFLIIPIPLFSQKTEKDFITDDDGITVEKLNTTLSYDDNYNKDNKIYKIGRRFIYSYYYENHDGKKFLVGKGEPIKQQDYFIHDWKFIPIDSPTEETVKNIILKPVTGNIFKNLLPDYNQTGISYEYVMGNNLSLNSETTGVVENEMNIWLHPPRSNFFEILEINPFPYIKAPYQMGNKWKWKLEIGDGWSDKRWKEWKGGIENSYEYEITDRKNISTKLGNLDCYVITAKATSRIGETGLISYFSPDFGFVKLEYKNIDGTKTVLELEKIE